MTPSILQSNSPVVTMTSIELLEVVNQARALHGEGEIRRNDFTARCMDELSGEYYETFVVKNPHGPASEVISMTRDQCMYVLMRESKAVRRTATEQLNRPVTPAIPTTLSAALRLAADQADQIEAQHAQLAIATPKADALDRIATATGSMSIREAAKTLQVKPLAFSDWLRANHWIFKQGKGNLAFQPRIDAGLMEHKITMVEVEGDDGVTFEKPVSRARITQKGLAKLAVVFCEGVA